MRRGPVLKVTQPECTSPRVHEDNMDSLNNSNQPESNNGIKDHSTKCVLDYQQVKRKLQALSKDIEQDISPEAYQKLRLRINEIIIDEELQSSRLHSRYESNSKDKINTKGRGSLPDKVFTQRNSLITDLWDNKHIGTIYHIFLAMLFGLFINTAAHDLLHKGSMKLGLNLIILSFQSIHKALFIWACMFCTTLSVFAGIYIWSRIRKNIKSYTQWDKFCCLLYVLYLFGFVYFYTNMVVGYKVTHAETIGLLNEMTRFLMKSHAFVRSNAPKIIKRGEDKEFSKFLYFLFAPTLVYQDTYPRSKTIRWKYVIACFTEVLGCMLFISFLFERFLVSDFQHFGIVEHTWQSIILIILGKGIAGMLLLLCTFYAILHSWHNGFAEMLRFADRLFYKDWWTSTSFGRFYITWNVIVHDWLYTYIYKDFYEIVVPNKKIVAKFMVFFVSAVFHEFILGVGFGFCFPILFIEFFVLGLAVSFVRVPYDWLGNFGLWYGLSLGMGIAMSTYCMEFFIRRNCPSEDDSIISYFVPKSIFGC